MIPRRKYVLWALDDAILMDYRRCYFFGHAIVIFLWSSIVIFFMVPRWCYVVRSETVLFYGPSMVLFFRFSGWCSFLWSLDGAIFIVYQ